VNPLYETLGSVVPSAGKERRKQPNRLRSKIELLAKETTIRTIATHEISITCQVEQPFCLVWIGTRGENKNPYPAGKRKIYLLLNTWRA
jgi:hypothetical protein